MTSAPITASPSPIRIAGVVVLFAIAMVALIGAIMAAPIVAGVVAFVLLGEQSAGVVAVAVLAAILWMANRRD